MLKTETFTIKQFDIEVKYNDILYSPLDIYVMLAAAINDREEFEEIQSEMEILNEKETVKHFFKEEK